MPEVVQTEATRTSDDSRWTAQPLLTVSSVGDLLHCGKKYDELRVKKRWPKNRPPPPPTVPRGSAWHETLRALHAARWQGQLPMSDLEAFAESAVYAARYTPDVDRAVEVKRVVEMARLFCAHQDPEDIDAIIALETQVEFDYSYKGERLVRIGATIDRALIRSDSPGRVVLQDFKSTRQCVSLAECFIIIFCGARKWPGYEYVLELIWCDAEDGTVVVDVITADTVRKQHKILTTALLRRLHEEPVAEPGPACPFCPRRDACQGLPPVDMAEGEEPF